MLSPPTTLFPRQPVPALRLPLAGGEDSEREVLAAIDAIQQHDLSPRGDHR